MEYRLTIKALVVLPLLLNWLAPSGAWADDRSSCRAVFGEAAVKPAMGPAASHQNGVVDLDWSGVRERLAQSEGLADRAGHLKFSIYVNGKAVAADIPWSQTTLKLPESTNKQMDYYVLASDGEKVVDISDFHLRESKDGQNLKEGSFTGLYAGEKWGIEFPESHREFGLSEQLTESAVRLGYKKIVWVLDPQVSRATRDFIDQAATGVDVLVEFKSNGKPRSIELLDRSTGKRKKSRVRDFIVKVDAAFSGNAFFWDDMLVALATVPYHPHLAESTVRFWLMVQKLNGGTIPREVRKDGLLSLWFPESVREGADARPNLSYTNPYLMNWVADALFRFNPSAKNRDLLKEVSKSIDDYSAWMEKNRSVRDESGEIIGFNGSALGTGADNSLGEVGNRGEAIAYETAFVDFISQQISMLKDQARWNIEFARSAKNAEEKSAFVAKARESLHKAKKYGKTLNERYWNEERGFYFSLQRGADGKFKQLTDYTTITGFWPLYAGETKGRRLDRLVEAQFTANTFGGDFPLPANARNSIVEGAKVAYTPREGFRNEDGYWDKWAHWPSMAMVVIDGLRRSGRPDVAYRLTRDYLKKMAESGKHTVEENYGEVEVILPDGTKTFIPRPGQHASHPHRPDFAGWGKGPPIYLALLDLIGVNARYDQVLHWQLRMPMRDGEKQAVNNLQYRGGTIERLSLTRVEGNRFILEADSSKPVSLELSSLLNSAGELSAEDQTKIEKIKLKKGRQRIEIELRPK